jgi:hypothetical protein
MKLEASPLVLVTAEYFEVVSSGREEERAASYEDIVLWREDDSAGRYEVLNNGPEVGNDPGLEALVIDDSKELKAPEGDPDAKALLCAPLLWLGHAIIEPEAVCAE